MMPFDRRRKAVSRRRSFCTDRTVVMILDMNVQICVYITNSHYLWACSVPVALVWSRRKLFSMLPANAQVTHVALLDAVGGHGNSCIA